MAPLSVADQFHLRAAEGWLELGNPNEAQAELSQLDPQLTMHPDVLHLRWQIQRRAKDWDACFQLARTLTETAPTDPRAWTALAQTYYYSARIQEAYDLAVSKITSFPKHWPLYYDAACYACLTGRLSQAKQFLQLATALGNESEVMQLAANDPDLKALWTP
jgi:hypothetical protein